MIGTRMSVTLLQVLCTAVSMAALAQAAAEQVPFVDSEGEYVAYLDTQRDDTIYLWSGEPIAYLYSSGTGQLVYSFAGRHLGWYEDGILRDLSGDAVGSREGQLRTPTRFAPAKGLQRLSPLRGLRDLPSLRPLFSNYYSRTGLLAFLSGASASTPSPSPNSPSTGGTYSGTGMRWWVSRIEDRGATVVLSDGSRWEIQTIDRIYTMLWLPVDNVTVALARSPIGNYRYSLTHERDGRVVLGRYLGR